MTRHRTSRLAVLVGVTMKVAYDPRTDTLTVILKEIVRSPNVTRTSLV